MIRQQVEANDLVYPTQGDDSIYNIKIMFKKFYVLKFFKANVKFLSLRFVFMETSYQIFTILS